MVNMIVLALLCAERIEGTENVVKGKGEPPRTKGRVRVKHSDYERTDFTKR